MNESATGAAAWWRVHRAFGIVLAAGILLRLATAPFVDAYILLNADFNAVNIVQLARQHDLPPLDDMEAGHVRDVLAFSSLYFVTAWLVDHLGIPPAAGMLVHHVAGPPALAAALYASAWVLFRSVPVAVLAALLLSFLDYGWFRANVGYPILFNESLYYGDVNHMFAGGLLAALLARRFTLAAAMSIALSLMNASYGLAGWLCLATLWAAARARGVAVPGLGGAALAGAAGVAGGYGLAMLALGLAPFDPGIAADVRDIAIRTYGHIAIHTGHLGYYIGGVGALLSVTLGVWLFERRRARDGGRDGGWFLLVSGVMMALVVAVGVIAYWTLFVVWPVGLIGLSPSKVLMLAALFACPYIAFAIARLAATPLAAAMVVLAVAAIALLPDRPALASVWLAAIGVVFWCVGAPRVALAPVPAAGVWVVAAAMGVQLCVATAWPFLTGRIALAHELRDASLRMRAVLSPDAVLVPYRLGAVADNPLGPWSNLALRTFSRRGYVPYWSIGRNAYFDSLRRQQLEERAFSAAGLVLWPEVVATLERERDDRPFEYYTGVAIRTAPCCAVSAGVPAPRRVLLAKLADLQHRLSAATPAEFAEYARRLGGTHLFISRAADAAAPWGPVLVESPHFVVIPIPDARLARR